MTDISIINIELLVLIRCLARLPVRNGYAKMKNGNSTARGDYVLWDISYSTQLLLAYVKDFY